MTGNYTLQTVSLPKKGITFRKVKDTTYVYFTDKIFRNSKGKPDNHKVLIGKMYESTGEMVPNKNYFKLFDVPAINAPKTIRNYGNYFLLKTIADKSGLSSVLAETFPYLWEEILTCAMYTCCEGNVFYYCDDWCETTYTSLDNPLTSQQIGEIFKRITFQERMSFFQKWATIRREKEYVAYDITLISSYAKDVELTEWGHNQDEEKLPQLNMSMFYGEDSSLPIYYEINNGSITAKTHLSAMVRNIDFLSISDVRFVMDKSFNTEKNLKPMLERDQAFLVGVSSTLQKSNEMIRKVSEEIKRSKCWLNHLEVHAKTVHEKVFGKTISYHIYYSDAKFAHEKNELFQKIETMEHELASKMHLTEKERKRYEKYFLITENESEFAYVRDNIKIDEVIFYLGYFVLQSFGFNLDESKILETYRKKDAIEQCFDNVKNFLDMKRLNTLSSSTTDGKVFIAFIGLILKSEIENTMHSELSTKTTTVKKILKEMEKIKLTNLYSNEHILTPLKKNQMDIMLAFGISEEELLLSVKNIKSAD